MNTSTNKVILQDTVKSNLIYKDTIDEIQNALGLSRYRRKENNGGKNNENIQHGKTI